MIPFFSMMQVFSCTLKLTSLNAFHTAPFGSPGRAGIKVQQGGDVQEKVFVTWTSQNPLVEWVIQRCKTATIGDAYEAFLSGTGNTPTGSALDTWITIDADLEWLLDQIGLGQIEFNGTLQIRQIANPGNIVSASVRIFAKVETP